MISSPSTPKGRPDEDQVPLSPGYRSVRQIEEMWNNLSPKPPILMPPESPISPSHIANINTAQTIRSNVQSSASSPSIMELALSTPKVDSYDQRVIRPPMSPEKTSPFRDSPNSPIMHISPDLREWLKGLGKSLPCIDDIDYQTTNLSDFVFDSTDDGVKRVQIINLSRGTQLSSSSFSVPPRPLLPCNHNMLQPSGYHNRFVPQMVDRDIAVDLSGFPPTAINEKRDVLFSSKLIKEAEDIQDSFRRGILQLYENAKAESTIRGTNFLIKEPEFKKLRKMSESTEKTEMKRLGGMNNSPEGSKQDDERTPSDIGNSGVGREGSDSSDEQINKSSKDANEYQTEEIEALDLDESMEERSSSVATPNESGDSVQTNRDTFDLGATMPKEEETVTRRVKVIPEYVFKRLFQVPSFLAHLVVPIIHSISMMTGNAETIRNEKQARGRLNSYGIPVKKPDQSTEAGHQLKHNPVDVKITKDELESFYNEHLKGKTAAERVFECIKLPKGPNTPLLSSPLSHSGTDMSSPLNCTRNRYCDNKDYITYNDLLALVWCVVKGHPGLRFLRSTPEFQSQYAMTVVERMLYAMRINGDNAFPKANCKPTSLRNAIDYSSIKISFDQFVRSDIASVLYEVDNEKDINKITRYFSYEHFYVLYCSLWDLDVNHDLMISMNELVNYDNYALSPLAVERIFDLYVGEGDHTGQAKGGHGTNTGGGRSKKNEPKDLMDYKTFIRFFMSEIDKTTPESLDFWFPVMDVDNDGVIGFPDIMFWLNEQQRRLQLMGIKDRSSVPDIMCGLIDMVYTSCRRHVHHHKTTIGTESLGAPTNRKNISQIQITKELLLKSRCQANFIDILLNVTKYLKFEEKDPSLFHHPPYVMERNPWDRYARANYDLLSAKETGEMGESTGYTNIVVDDMASFIGLV